MDGHEDLPPTAPARASVVSTAAAASSGAGTDRLTLMQSPAAAATSTGVGADHLALVQSTSAAAATSTGVGADRRVLAQGSSAAAASSGARGFSAFDIRVVNNLVAQRDWDNLDLELKKLVAVKEGVNPVLEHPYIFIPVYEEWITELVKKQDHAAARKLFTDKVTILYYANKSDFVNEEDLKDQVNRLHRIANIMEPVKDISLENIQTALTDYVHLYFPILLSRPENDRPSHLWRFAKMVRKPASQKHPNFKCLACGELFKNCAISKMRDHLDVRTSGSNCPKLTRNIQIRFEEGEGQQGKTKCHGPRHGKVGKIGTQNLVIQEIPPAADENLGIQEIPPAADENLGIQEIPPAADQGAADDTLVEKLVQVVHSSAESLQIAAAGKPLEPRVEKQLRAARNLLSQVLSQKYKHT